MKTYCINSFTGYKRIISHRGEYPSTQTMDRHNRASKASDCMSACMFIREDGRKISYQRGTKYTDEIIISEEVGMGAINSNF